MPGLAQGVTFSIPQFGDFFHDMVCRTRLSQFQSSILSTPLQAATSAESATNPALFPNNGTTATGVAAPGTFYNLVDASGNLLVAGVTVSDDVDPNPAVQYRNLVRYCEYPGERLFRFVKFDVNGNPLDEYNEIVPVMLRKFCLPPNKVVGYKHLVGQEVPLEGYGKVNVSPVNDFDIGSDGIVNTPAGIYLNKQGHGFGLFNSPNAGDTLFAGGSAPAPTVVPFAALNEAVPTGGAIVDFSRELKAFVDGPQTPKPAQPNLEIWNKLR
jgi:hypothetical protein